MMRAPFVEQFLQGRRYLVAAAVALLTLNAGALAAQQAVITGKVTAASGEALGGATVSVTGTDANAVSSATGTFTITVGAGSARGQATTVTARFIGYKPMSKPITLRAGNQEVNFALDRDPFRLEEVIVTGTAEATTMRKTTFTVGRVNEEQLQEVPGASALVAVQGKISAVRLVPTSAQPGGEVSLRLRGATSIGGRQDPLIIVDGVITQFGLSDMAPEDIERVEVIKGAAASSLYGSNAANGVVQVFTKRGDALADGSCASRRVSRSARTTCRRRWSSRTRTPGTSTERAPSLALQRTPRGRWTRSAITASTPTVLASSNRARLQTTPSQFGTTTGTRW
jgi:TonB-dependent SusC/RagA subfamily outer membrane receptor